MIDITKAVLKVRRPPSVPNWAKHNSRRADRTAAAIARFALASPRIRLQPVYNALAMMVIDQQPLEVALKVVEALENPVVRRAGIEILTAFERFNRDRCMDGIEALHKWETVYPLTRGVVVPVKPTFVILENGRPKPVFVIGWASTRLDDFQMRLLCTVIHEAVLTQQEFLGSDAEILLFPRSGRYSRNVISRTVRNAWLLTPAELARQIAIYGSALDIVPSLIQRMAEDRERR